MLMLILLSDSSEQLHPTNPVTVVDDIIIMLRKLLSHCKRIEFTITKSPICNIRVKPLIKCWDLPGMSFRLTSYEQQRWKCTKRSYTLLSDCCTKMNPCCVYHSFDLRQKCNNAICNHILQQWAGFQFGLLPSVTDLFKISSPVLQLNIYMCCFCPGMSLNVQPGMAGLVT